MITSTRNPKIQWVRSLQARSRNRREEGLFVVEGVRLAEEALQAGWQAQLVLFTEQLSDRGQELVSAFEARGAPVEAVSEAAMRTASDTQTPQGILAVLAQQELPFPSQLDFLFVADGVRDPGNLGAILRTAAAAGVQGVFLPTGAVDAFSPKVVRAAMGAHFRLPLRSLPWPEINVILETTGLRVYLAAAGAGKPYTQADFNAPLALIVGGEAEGAGVQAQKLANEQVHIPMPGGMESLNAAIAAAILLFEVVRQRNV